MNNQKLLATWAGISLAVIVFALASLVLLKDRLGIADDFYTLYFRMLVAGTVAIGLFVLVEFTRGADKANNVEKSLYIAEEAEHRPLSQNLWIPVGTALLLGIALFVSLNTGSNSLFAPPNPYGLDTPLSAENTVGFSTLQNLYLIAFIPSIAEEAVVFAIIASLWLLASSIAGIVGRVEDLYENPITFWGLNILFVAAASLLFSFAHARYGGNDVLFIRAFVFEFGVQMLNILGGAFVSWIPHMLHNAGVIVGRAFAISLAAVVPFAVINYWRLRRNA